MMKILMTSHFYKPSWESGGVTRVSYELATELSKLGHDVTVYTTNMSLKDYNVPLHTETIVDGVKVYYFDNLRRIFKTTLLSFPYRAPFLIKKHIREFDIIHIHEYRSFMNLCVTHYARKYHIPYVIQGHGSMPVELPGQNRMFILFKRIFDILFGKKMLSGLKIGLSLSPDEENDFLRLGIPKDKIQFLPNGINESEFSSLPDKSEFRIKHQIDDETKIILFLGRLHKTKGLDLLVDAFSLVCKEQKKVLLVLAGPDGGMLEILRQKTLEYNIDNQVLFLGPVFGNDKIETYRTADIFVLTSEYEIYSLSVIEAMACGIPVLITDNLSAAQFFKNHGGYSCSRSPEEIAKKLEIILSDKSGKLDNAVNLQRQVIMNELTWNNISQDLVKLYNTVLKK